MIHSVVQTYHSVLTEPINFHHQYMKKPKNPSKFFRIEVSEGLVTKNTTSTVQLSQKLAPSVFPPLPYCQENLQFVEKEMSFSEL